MPYYAVYIEGRTDLAIKEFYEDKAEALALLKKCKEARMKEFSTAQEATDFFRNGEVNSTLNVTATPKKDTVSTTAGIPQSPKSAFPAPSSQKLVDFRKQIETNNIAMVKSLIHQNPRYLISSGDTPTVLKEGTRYNALHVAAIHDRGEVCRLILETIERSAYVELLHGQRTPSTTEVCRIIFDMYLNTPDKSRGETPLHFAAKYGSVSVVKELIAYPQCKVTKNKDGLLPSDIICSRANSVKNTAEIAQSIRELLKERYFVPVWRSEDECVLPVVGKPFRNSPNPAETCSPGSPGEFKLKAYAGPMDREQAQAFFVRWRTPPRLIPSPLSESVDCSNQRRLLATSTPQKVAIPRRLILTEESEQPGNNLRLQKGNGGGAVDDLLDALSNDFAEIVSLESAPDCVTSTSTPQKNGSVRHRVANNSGAQLCDLSLTNGILESGTSRAASSVLDAFSLDISLNKNEISFVCNQTQQKYDQSNLPDSPYYRERSIRIKDHRKGLETIGRNLASQYGVEWHEFWDFLGGFANLLTADGLQQFENMLASRNMKVSPVCELQVAMTDMKLTEVTQPVSGSKLLNSYACLVKTLQVFVVRFKNLFSVECAPKSPVTIDPAVAKLINSLDWTVDSYRKDKGFVGINFAKVHSIFAYLLLNSIVHDTQQSEHLLGKMKELFLSRPDSPAVVRNVNCVRRFFRLYMTDLTVLKCHMDECTEQSCRDLWEREELISECDCHEMSEPIATGNRTLDRMNQRRQQRSMTERPRSLFNQPARSNSDSEYDTCDDEESDYWTPPTSPPQEKLECYSDIDGQVFIGGSVPNRNDEDVWNVLATVNVDQARYPHVHRWHRAMRNLSANVTF